MASAHQEFYGLDYMVFPGFLRYSGGRGGEGGGAESREKGEGVGAESRGRRERAGLGEGGRGETLTTHLQSWVSVGAQAVE